MNARFALFFVCLLAACLVGCSSGQKAASGRLPPASEAELVYPKPHAPAMPGPSAPQPGQTAQSVYFGTDETGITPQAQSALKSQAEWLKQNPHAKMEITGNTDPRAGEEYNRTLGQKRAEAVKDYLVGLGVSPDRLETRSYGKDRPVCNEATENCYASGRRVDLEVTG